MKALSPNASCGEIAKCAREWIPAIRTKETRRDSPDVLRVSTRSCPRCGVQRLEIVGHALANLGSWEMPGRECTHIAEKGDVKATWVWSPAGYSLRGGTQIFRHSPKYLLSLRTKESIPVKTGWRYGTVRRNQDASPSGSAPLACLVPQPSVAIESMLNPGLNPL